MGWLSKLWSTDPQAELDKAKQLMAKEPERAFELIQGLLDQGEAEHRAQAQQALETARTAVIERALERARMSEEEEYFEDAAQWLEAAIEHTVDDARRQELEARHHELMRRELLLAEEETGGGTLQVHRTVEATIVTGDADNDDLFSAAVDVFKEEVATRYRHVDDPFRRLFMQLQDGHLDGLEDGLNALLQEDAEPDDTTRAVVTLERGKLRLLIGEFAAARDDFEACWQAWGDDPLDWSGSVSLPGLWAEASLELADFDGIIDRFEDLAEPRQRRMDVILPYAQALVLGRQLDEAAPYLREAIGTFPSHQELPLLYALTLDRSGDPAEAIACLEMAIAASCASGHCSKPPMHMPSLRMLLALKVQHQPDDLDRLTELGQLLLQHSGGRLLGDDHRILARIYSLQGQDRIAERELELAETADARGVDLLAEEPLPKLGGTEERIL